MKILQCQKTPPLSHFVRHLIFIIGQSIAVFFGSRQPSLNLASLSAKLYNSIYIAKNKKAKKKWKNVNSEFAEHPPSLDTIRPLCIASIISSFLCSFLSTPRAECLSRTVPCNSFVSWCVYINVFCFLIKKLCAFSLLGMH